MTEHPILFSAPMVRAILEGRKTQTRRVIKPQPSAGVRNSPFVRSGLEDGHGRELRCPYGRPGDKLWVRETIRKTGEFPDGYASSEYVADGTPTVADAWPWQRRTLAAIHCPRGLSRILLEITDVRVQRVQDIDDGDALEEGIHTVEIGSGYSPRFSAFSDSWQAIVESQARAHDWPRDAFRDLWDTINAMRGFGWDANPWVWALTFKRVEGGERE